MQSRSRAKAAGDVSSLDKICREEVTIRRGRAKDESSGASRGAPPVCGREQRAAAEGEIARNLSGKRTVNGKDTLESRGHQNPRAEGVSASDRVPGRESLRLQTEGHGAVASSGRPSCCSGEDMTGEATKTLPLEDLHQAAGAKFGAFAGWSMPLTYPAGVMKEHQHTREHVGLFDISHMKLFAVSGPGAASLLNRAATRLPTKRISRHWPGISTRGSNRSTVSSSPSRAPRPRPSWRKPASTAARSPSCMASSRGRTGS